MPFERQTVESSDDVAARRAAADAGRTRIWEQSCPGKFRNARVENLSVDQHRDVLSSWLDSGSPTLVLVGKVGPGKSYAAHAIGHAAFATGMSVVSYGVAELTRLLRYNPADEAAASVHYARATGSMLTIFDDLGQEKTTEAAAAELWSIIEQRTSSAPELGARQILTLNLGSDEIRNRYGASFLERIEENATIVRFTGASRRQPAAVY